MKPSEVQEELVPGAVGRREAPRSYRRAPVAAHAVEVLGQLRGRMAAKVRRDPCRAGGDHEWVPVERPGAERGVWPPGPWLRCGGCRLFTQERNRP